MKAQVTNKAIGEDITYIAKNGIDVNINILTDSLVRLGVFVVVIAVIISGLLWGMKRL